jgi:hypothetical protein
MARQCDELSKIGKGQPDAHINPMPHKGSSPRTLDLFEDTITVPSPRSEPASAPVEPPELARWSDAQLVERLEQLIDELKRRMGKGGARRPELEAAAKQASLSLQHLVPGPTHQDRRQRSSKRSSLLQEGQRKAVRAALLAGVAPNQVAKHFGLSLAAIRKVLEEGA